MDNFLQQMVPTRDKYIINDLVLTGNTAIIHNTQVDGQFGSSDHKIITVDIRLCTAPINQTKRKVYLYSKGDYTSFQEAANNIDWTNILSSKSIHHQWAIFKNIYNRLLDQHVPFKLLRPGFKVKSPWLRDKNLPRSRKRRRCAQGKLSKTNLHADQMDLNIMTEQYHKDINRAQSLYEERLARNVGENPRMLYNYTKNFTKSSSSIECLIVEGEKITNPVTI